MIERTYPLFVASPALFGAMTFALEELWLQSGSSPDVRNRAGILYQRVRSAFIAFHRQHTARFQAPPAIPSEDNLNVWVHLDGGDFTMGTNDRAIDAVSIIESTPHRVKISGFSMQQHEVTNEEFRRFDPTHQFSAGEEQYPTANVTWYEASGYAAWLAAGLPTEAQWEYAARGTGTEPPTGKKGRRYPWGNEPPTRERAVFSAVYTQQQKAALAVFPLRRMGATPEGIYDMAGNVSEWCRDLNGPYKLDDFSDPRGPIGREVPDRPSGRVQRGLSFGATDGYMRATHRSWGVATYRGPDLGFRLVSSRFR